jgi:glutathione S-transferase
METRPEESSPPRLFHFRVSHYNEKVRWALDHKKWPHHRTAMVPGFHVPVVRWKTGQQQLPTLEIDGRILFGSSQIIAELERLRPDPPLYPADPALVERALGIEKFFDDEVAPDLRRIFWSTYLEHPADCTRMATDGFGPFIRATWRVSYPIMRPLLRQNMGISKAKLENARGRMLGYFDRLESEIGPSGYLAGDRFGIADLAAAAVMTAIIRPPEFPYPIPEPWPAELVELRASVADRPGCKWVLDIYARHRGASFEIGA